jgi:multiple sugar transport system substrate-binding protein
MKKNKTWVILASCLLLLAVAGCGGKGGEAQDQGNTADKTGEAQTEQHSPITLKFGGFQADNRQPLVDNVIRPFLTKKFPYMTVEYVKQESGNVDKLIVTGEVPDVVIAGYARIPDLLALDIPLDLTELAKKNKLDLGQYNPVPLGAVKAYSNPGQLNALPFSMNTFALFYNKDIFDKFGAPYPKDEMTWPETIELTKKVTRNEGGHAYSGLQYSNNNANFARGVALQLVNPQTNKAAFNNDNGLKVLNTLKEIYGIPGNESQGKVLERFLSGDTAMIPWWADATFTAIGQNVSKGAQLNWDMVTYPHFDGFGNKTLEPAIDTYVVSKVSKLPDEAFKAIAYLSSNLEVQTESAKNGDIPVANVPKLGEIYGSNVAVLKGKNVAGMLKGQFQETHIPSRYDPIAADAFNKFSKQFTDGKIGDARTALAQAEEEANKKIAEAMQ